jgi:hypothetical protein
MIHCDSTTCVTLSHIINNFPVSSLSTENSLSSLDGGSYRRRWSYTVSFVLVLHGRSCRSSCPSTTRPRPRRLELPLLFVLHSADCRLGGGRLARSPCYLWASAACPCHSWPRPWQIWVQERKFLIESRIDYQDLHPNQ